MARKLYELVGTDTARRFSPYCWMTRMALAHKGLDAESIPWRFTEKEAIAPFGSEKVPVLLDGDKAVADSWTIATYLEDAYPDRPSLFGGDGGRAMGRLIRSMGELMIGNIATFIVADVHSHLGPTDQAYFRQSREARFGKSLEAVVADREVRVDAFRKSLDPLRLMLRAQPFVGGQAPNYADYTFFGPLQWSRAISPFKLLDENDPVYAWREKMLDAFGGMARQSPGYAL